MADFYSEIGHLFFVYFLWQSIARSIINNIIALRVLQVYQLVCDVESSL